MEKKIQITVLLVFMAFAGMFLASCYPSDSVTYSDLDVVGTLYDTEKDFKTLKTYALPDTIIHLVDTTDESNNVDISRKYDDQILSLVNQNMLDYGYTEEMDPLNNKPDVVVTVSAMATKNYNVWYWYPYYWYGYPGWGWYKSTENTDYWYGWYPGYPTYPGWGTTVTSYTTGTILINMMDLSGFATIDPEVDTIPIAWYAGINGLMGSSTSNTQSRIDYTINQAFEQSPYLDTK